MNSAEQAVRIERAEPPPGGDSLPAFGPIPRVVPEGGKR